MADIISKRRTVIMVANEDSLLPADDLYPSDNLYPAGDSREITNIVAGSLRLDEILSEAPIAFGQMYSTKFEVQVYGEEDLSGKWIHVYQLNDGVYTDIFSGKIDSCKTDKIGTDRTIVAYDKAYTFGQLNVAPWWESFWTDRATATLKQARESMLQWCNISFESVTLPNDSLTVQKNVTLTNCCLTDMLRMMCELSCCFPHMDRTGYLEFIILDTEATPVDISDAYEWMNSDFQDFETSEITGVQFYDSDNQLKYTVGTSTNAYPIRQNIFLYKAAPSDESPEMVDTTVLQSLGTAILNYLKDLKYTPASVKMILSDLDLKLGDYVETSMGNFYILENSYSGSQLIEQTIKAPGDQVMYEGTPVFNYGEIVLNEKIARVKYSVEQLEITFAEKVNGIFANYKGNYVPAPNVSTSTANEPASTWISQGTQADHVGEVFYNENSLGSYGIYYRWDKVGTNSYRWNQIATSLDAYTVVSSTFKQTADSISTEVTRATSAEGSLSSRITQNANAITAEVSRASGVESTLSSAISLTADGLSTEVTRATNAEAGISNTLNSTIQQLPNMIATKVTEETSGIFANYKGDSNNARDTISNAWSSDATKQKHLGEVFYNTSTGKYYRWQGGKISGSGSKIKVNFTYQTESTSYDWIEFYVKTGNTTYKYTAKYGGNTKTTADIYLPVPTDNIIRVWFRTDASQDGYYGFKINSITKADSSTDNAPNTASTVPSDGTTINEYLDNSPNNLPETDHSHYGNGVRTLYRIYIDFAWVEIEVPSNSSDYAVISSMTSSIEQTAKQITFKVSESDLVTSLNSQLTIASNRIELNSDGKIIINGTNFKVDANGKLTANGAEITGKLTSGTNSGYKIVVDEGQIKSYYNGSQKGYISSAADGWIHVSGNTGVSMTNGSASVIIQDNNQITLTSPSDIYMYGNALKLTGLDYVIAPSGDYGGTFTFQDYFGNTHHVNNGILID